MKQQLSVGLIACAACLASMFLASNAHASTQTFIYLSGDPGEYITGGQTYFYTSQQGTFTSPNGSDTADFVDLRVVTADGQHLWDAAFSTHYLGVPLQAGTTYQVPLNLTFDNLNAADMNVSGDNRGDSSLSGSFTIYDILVVNNSLQSLAVGFNQYASDSTAGLHGYIWYNSAVASPVPIPDSVWLLGSGLIGLVVGTRKRKSLNAVIADLPITQ